MTKCMRALLMLLFALFCFAYPFAVIGVAFDVHPPFSLDWAGSALLFIEGSLLVVAALPLYGILRTLLVALLIIGLSYVVETLGVNTGVPFGAYRYTPILFPSLPGGVPLAVLFAWVLIIFGAYGWVVRDNKRIGMRGALLGALLAMLLDLAIEPVAFHVVNYWQWLRPPGFNYYGVPLANFVAWFLVAWLLLVLADAIFLPVSNKKLLVLRLSLFMPRLLFITSLFMFGLVDLTHGYYVAVVIAVFTSVLLWRMRGVPLVYGQG